METLRFYKRRGIKKTNTITQDAFKRHITISG
jgi:hypothetical protein